jgi:hypothetical protein
MGLADDNQAAFVGVIQIANVPRQERPLEASVAR